MVRLNQIECKRGLLERKGHILLQFTGFLDQAETELYENDVVLKGMHKYMICWSAELGCWYWQNMSDQSQRLQINEFDLEDAVRLCNYYEMTGEE